MNTKTNAIGLLKATAKQPSRGSGNYSKVDRKPNSSLWVLLWIAALILSFTVEVSAADYVIVVDVSGSMTGSVSHRNRDVRITVVQEALKRYLPALPQESRVDLTAFSSGILSEPTLWPPFNQSLGDPKSSLRFPRRRYRQAGFNQRSDFLFSLWRSLL